jgi:broad specificity phosphatase PhoE
MTTIGFLRHGQTDWNIDFRLQGISDIPLNEKGRSQAHTAIPKLASLEWDVVVCSPLSRALETAQIVSRGLMLEDPIIHNELLERSFGEAEGLTYEVWRDHFQSGERAAGAESLAALEQRARHCLSFLAELYPGKRVLAVSHGAFIRKILNLVSKGALPLEGQRLGNLSLAIMNFDDLQWSVTDYHPQSLG